MAIPNEKIVRRVPARIMLIMMASEPVTMAVEPAMAKLKMICAKVTPP